MRRVSATTSSTRSILPSPLLERESALDGLEVVEHGLRLDSHDPAVASDEGVPRASIAFDRERYLGSPAEPRVKTDADPPQEPILPGVPDRIASWVCPESNIQSHGGAVRGELAGRRAARPGFQSLDCRTG